MSDHPSEHPSQASKSEIESQSKPESEVFRTSHSYNDGNITLDIRGTKFKLHKSILTLHSEAFKDMFGLPEVHPVESQDTPVSLDDDPKAFDAALNAIYKGVEFIRGANIIQLMDAITITHKYQMNRLEGYLQDHITERILPSSAPDGVNGFGFDHYDEHPGLATAVLRLGAERARSMGVLHYSFLVLRQIVHNAFEDWDKRISDFYASSCSRAANAKSFTALLFIYRPTRNALVP
ncbi:hypothetical protein OPQ81_004460 [Rhizoctonia solani]|nr:hypothetical protein OPQ81_004460 [Rhizoctonia solani]